MDTMTWAQEEDDIGCRLTVVGASRILKQHGFESKVVGGSFQGLVIMSGRDYDVWETIAAVGSIRHVDVFAWLGY